MCFSQTIDCYESCIGEIMKCTKIGNSERVFWKHGKVFNERPPTVLILKKIIITCLDLVMLKKSYKYLA